MKKDGVKEESAQQKLTEVKTLFQSIRDDVESYRKSLSNQSSSMWKKGTNLVGRLTKSTMGPEGFARRERLLKAIDEANSVEDILKILGTPMKNYNQENETGYYFPNTKLETDLNRIVYQICDLDEREVQKEIETIYKNLSEVTNPLAGIKNATSMPMNTQTINFQTELKQCLYFCLTSSAGKYSVNGVNGLAVSMSLIGKEKDVFQFKVTANCYGKAKTVTFKLQKMSSMASVTNKNNDVEMKELNTTEEEHPENKKPEIG